MSASTMLTDSMAAPLDSLEDGIAWLEAREDFQEVKARYEALLESKKPKTASQRTEELDKLPLSELVKILDEQPPFDLVSGITDFLRELGAFNEPLNDDDQGSEQNDKITGFSEEVLVDAPDMDLLASVLPPVLASKLGRSPTSTSHSDISIPKGSILNTLARLSLSPPLTIIIARSFRPLFVDLASRWLLLLGFNGTKFEASHASTGTLVLVLAALGRTLPEFPQLYPLLLIVVHHPHLQAESLVPLLGTESSPSILESPSSALNPSPSPKSFVYSSDLPQLLLALYCVLSAVPQLPLMTTIHQNFGGPSPPSPVGETLSTHPRLAMRTLAWQIASMWLGWEGPKKEELRRKYVYDPALDAENGKTNGLKTVIPLRNPEEGLRDEETLQFWPRVPLEPQAHCLASGALSVRLEQHQIDAWILQESVIAHSSHEWTVVRQAVGSSPILDGQHRDMAVDDNIVTLVPSNRDMSPLIADVAGVALVKEVYVSHSARESSIREQSGTANSSTLPEIFISTKTSTTALRQLAAHVSSRHPVLLSSPPSAGKATTLQQLHRLLYRTQDISTNDQQAIVTINLADKSLDAKNLLGTLTSSPTEPGAFIFAEGSLTRAVRHGRWVVLEDIDKASDEVLSTIAELVERIRNRVRGAIGGGWGGTVSNGVGVHAGGQWIEASENFMLFATRSLPAVAAQAQHLEAAPSHTAPTFFGSQYWNEIWMDVPSLEEIQAIIEGRFSRLHRGIVDSLVRTWVAIAESANSMYSTSSTGLSRSVGIRDLVNWCQRIEAALPLDIAIATLSQNPTFQDEAFLEARDIFLNCFPARGSVYDGIVTALQSGLELSQERVDWLLQSRIPEILANGEKAGSYVHYGRIALQKGKNRQTPSASKRPYALTKPFLVLLEELAACVKFQEPVLLVGETGTGKTTAVAQLADMLGHNLTALNLSNQTEASDLLGGFRPINEADEVARNALQLVNKFTDLFASSFEASRNLDFGIAVQKAFKKKRWSRMAGLFREAARLAGDKLARAVSGASNGTEGPRKKRKLHSQNLLASWQTFLKEVGSFEDAATEASAKSSKFKFAFVEGPLVRALRNGDWVLLDEINLATSETLESLSSLLQSSTSSVVLTERGDLEPVQRHSDFRLFACMNPANDVGKRDLPPALRTKFTEIFVRAPDSDKEVLLSVIQNYIGHVAVGDRGVVQDIAELYLKLKDLARDGRLADGSNQPPHFSMRTLARSLVFAADFASEFGIRRSAYEGISMCFTTSLDGGSKGAVTALMHDYLVERSKSPRSFFKTIMSPPSAAQSFVAVGSFWLAKGSDTPQAVEDYVLTPSVEDKLINLTRAVAAARFPILLQGPTSSGKTSIIEYLAKRSGHHFVRINNHEHTDIQEYLGTYMSDPETGKLVFQEGLLVTAVREGHWIVLDELNLAPTDVLEALNRLLDDNRELVIPETQEVVKPHPHFMLFATQNPPGLYGGRKILSRAFRNRFLEMQFSDVPQDELEIILCQRCQIAPSYAKKIVAVFLELQRRRQGTRLFEEKQAFVTLRDLFRWGNRGAVGYEQLALDGYMLLAERTRQEEDKRTVQAVLEEIMKVSLEPQLAYEKMFVDVSSPTDNEQHRLVWTLAMKRLYVLIRTALSFNEPVLLVGETGSGKTSVCQAVAEALGRKLHIVNCHQNTETSDLIGSQRPVRNRSAIQEAVRLEALEYLTRVGLPVPDDANVETILSLLQVHTPMTAESRVLLQRLEASQALFIWNHGPLVEAMKRGDLLLLDEISLADDSVLERLNSVLEPARTLTVAEKGSKDLQDVTIKAHEDFQIVGTMNPGGDFGKKELSPALRNRFTEIWVPWLSTDEDILGILRARLRSLNAPATTTSMLTFARWFTEQVRPREKYQFGSVVTLRDLLAWADFIVSFEGDNAQGFIHGALMTLLDSLGSTSNTTGFAKGTILALREKSLVALAELVSGASEELSTADPAVWAGQDVFNHFLSRISSQPLIPTEDWHFSFNAPTVRLNALRVLRALQVSKPVLLEGSPGVGKTSLVTALAKVTDHTLCRINLSDQTDLVDLFGNDSPVEGGKAGEFSWVDAPFLAAMQAGHWVLLDEMNLASQSVLEGLNSCLDHRGTVYIPELDKVFTKHPRFRIFAAQNPTNQGGSRKGLPRSFVDRFTQVYMDDLDSEDYFQICSQLYPLTDPAVLRKMVAFVAQLSAEVAHRSGSFQAGSPWELNLRDLLRWLSMMEGPNGYERYPGQPLEYLDHLFLQRFRQPNDRERVLTIFEDLFGKNTTILRTGRSLRTSKIIRFGRNLIERTDPLLRNKLLLQRGSHNGQLRAMQALASALACNQLLILTGATGSGKSSLIQDFADATGRRVRTFYANAQTDTLEMLGSFEQCSRARQYTTVFAQAQLAIENAGTICAHVDDWSWIARCAALLEGIKSAVIAKSNDTATAQALLSELLARVEGTHIKEAVEDLAMSLRQIDQDSAVAGRFEFVDGVLVQAMKAGDILVIENANRCSPAVLDRLNGLFEPGGVLFLGERGLTADGKIPQVNPHPDFRVVMTLDPRTGELSRAMRNRGVEVALLDAVDVCPKQSLSAHITSSVQCRHSVQDLERLDQSQVTPTYELERASLVHSIGTKQITSVPKWLRLNGDSLEQKLLLHAVLEDQIWAGLASARPGAVLNNLPGQTHQTTFFSLDTNEALKERPCADGNAQINLDSIVASLVSIHSIRLGAAHQLRSALSKSMESLNVLEQAYLHTSYPARLPSVPKGTASIRHLQEALIAAAMSTNRSAIFGAPCEVASLFQLIASFLVQLDNLGQSHSLNYTIYQAILTEMKRRFEALSVPDFMLAVCEKLSLAIKVAEDAVKRSTGLFMEPIWQYYQSANIIVTDELAGALDANTGSLPPDLTKLYVDVAVSASGKSTASDMVLLHGLRDKITGYLSQPLKRPVPSAGSILVAISELQTVTQAVRKSSEATSLINVAAYVGQRTLQSILPLANQLANPSVSPVNAISEWTAYLVSTQATGAITVSDLLTDSELRVALQAAHDSATGPLANISEIGEGLRIAGQAHFELASAAKVSRSEGLLVLVLTIVSETIHAAFGMPLQENATDPWTLAESLRRRVESRSDIPGALSLARSIQHLIDARQNPQASLAATAKVYVTVAAWSWALYVPDIPIDPTLASQAVDELHRIEWNEMLADATVERGALKDPGGLGGIRFDTTVRRLQHLDSLLRDLEGTKPRGKARLQELLASLFLELRSCGRILQESDVLNAITSENGSPSQPQLENLQSSLIAIHRRLGTFYKGYADIIQPLATSLGVAVLGLGIRIHLLSLASHGNLSHIISVAASKLAALPTAVGLQELKRIELPTSADSTDLVTISPAAGTLVRLYALAAAREITTRDLDPTDYQVIKTSYEHLFTLWTIDHKRAEQARLQSESIYRSRREDFQVAADAAQEEEELLSLFPKFEDLGSVDQSSNVSGLPESGGGTLLRYEDILHTHRAHEALFGEQLNGSEHTIAAAPYLNSIRKSILTQMHDVQGSLLSEEVDLVASQTTLGVLAEAARNFGSGGTGMSADFYRDPNVAEVLELQAILQTALGRISELMLAWPEQMVLSDLADRCRALLAVPASAPIARMLAFVESLLFKIADWEAYASRETSLQATTDRLTALVVKWRRLELQSWAGLLLAQEKAFREPIAEWWFRMYEVCVHGPSTSDAEDQSSSLDYIDNLLQVVRTLVESSPAGQFRDRLRLVEAFANFSRGLSQNSTSVHMKIATALSNLVGFYEDLANRVEVFLKEERLKIEKDVNEVIRLASWKDVNIYALKASAQKSHRQLYKRVRALRKVLDTPVSRFATSDKPKEFGQKWERSSGVFDRGALLSQCPTKNDTLPEEHMSALPKYLLNLPATVKRLDSLIQADSNKLGSSSLDGQLELLSESIIQRSQELRAEQPTAKAKEDRLKQAKSLMDRKRKAWSSLLAEAKRIGLSPRPSTTLVQRLKSLGFLFKAGPLCLSGDFREALPMFEDVTRSIDTYYYRFCAIMPAVRSAASQHHEDVIPSQIQAAAGFLDSSLNMVHSTRKDLYHGLYETRALMHTYRQFEALAQDGIATDPCASDVLVSDYFETYMLLKSSLSEMLSASDEHLIFMPETYHSAFADYRKTVEAQWQTSSSIAEYLSKLKGSGTSVPASKKVMAYLGHAKSSWQVILGELSAVKCSNTQFAYLLDPVISWMKRSTTKLEIGTAEPIMDKDELSPAALTAYTNAMSAILVIVQNLEDLQEQIWEEKGDFTDAGLMIQYRRLQKRSGVLRVHDIGQRVQLFKVALTGLTRDAQQSTLTAQLLKRSIPFIASYLTLAMNHLDRYMVWHRALLKFAYIFAQTTLTIANEGFCRPTESEEGPSESTNFEGTGMGSGEGTKNVSDEIENQEQVEGLENEEDQETPPDNGEKDGKDDMLDMEDDFGGTAQDVDQEESDDKSDNGDKDEEDDVDEELGNVDPLDPSAVDDKFWDDKEEPKDDGKSPEPEEQSAQNPGRDDKGDMGERQEPERGSKEDETPQDEADVSPDDTKPEENQNDPPPDPEDEEGKDGSEAPEGGRQELPDMNLDEQTLDLPDDLDLEPPAKEDGEDDDIDDELEPDMLDAKEPENGENPEETNGDEDGPDTADSATNNEVDDDQTGMEEDEGAFSHQSAAGADGGSGEGSGEALDAGEEQANAQGNEDGKDKDLDTDSSLEQKAVDADQLEDNAASRQQLSGTDDAAINGEGDDAGAGMPSTSQPPTDQSRQSEQAQQSTERQLGDQTQSFMRRLEAISDPTDSAVDENGLSDRDNTSVPENGELEYVPEGDHTDLQAMGAAAEEDAAKGGVDSTDPEMLDEFQSMGLDQGQSAEDQVLQHYIPETSNGTEGDQQLSDETLEDFERSKIDPQSHAREAKRIEDESPEPEDASGRTEVILQHWLTDGRESLPAEEVWRLYTNLTRDLSFSLTESLRLVLEPTLATRLKGDYRTGKRLNMRKIIPYIASDYTKDKIWLRRTRPSQREYQVLLALDDSRSMADSRAVHLAYQTLALVCQSLTKLEVGEVSVCKFGEHTDFIHNFEDGPVSDTVGANIVDSFSFAQKSTDIRRLLESSLQRFQLARDRRGGTSADLWQLEIIVSDGMCQDLDDIRALLRKAREQKVMVMFVVLDSLHQDKPAANGHGVRENSILSMKSVSYQKGKTGALELKMERYMDTFPFEYYVVLRDVETLPEVLGETLRQFFDKVRGDN